MPSASTIGAMDGVVKAHTAGRHRQAARVCARGGSASPDKRSIRWQMRQSTRQPHQQSRRRRRTLSGWVANPGGDAP